jgi:hypothetical protein
VGSIFLNTNKHNSYSPFFDFPTIIPFNLLPPRRFLNRSLPQEQSSGQLHALSATVYLVEIDFLVDVNTFMSIGLDCKYLIIKIAG